MKKFGIFFLAFSLSLSACANNADNKSHSEVKSQTSSQARKVSAPSASNTKIDADLANAKKEGVPVFVVVQENGSSDIERALTIAQKASGLTPKKAKVIKLDRGDASNKVIVKEWGLSGAPLPIIMCVSPKGNVTGGFLISDATPEKLANTVPSPKYDDVYTALSAQNAAYVIVGDPNDEGVKKLQQTCATAAKPTSSMEAVTITVNPNDKAEQDFIKLLTNGQPKKTPMVFVINRQGRVVASYDTSATKIQLQNSAMMTVGGSCCGSGGC